jgi:hypothetical protein
MLKSAKTPVVGNENNRKKPQPFYVFRNVDSTIKKHNDVVMRTFGKRSLSHVAEA